MVRRRVSIAVACLATVLWVAWGAATHLVLAGTRAASADGSSNDRSDHVPTLVVVLAFALIAVAGSFPLLIGRLRSRTDD
jgi:uncharacterized membrane protein YbhN (UPF0104 family)